jgi:hypothetical protein
VCAGIRLWRKRTVGEVHTCDIVRQRQQQRGLTVACRAAWAWWLHAICGSSSGSVRGVACHHEPGLAAC